MVVRGVGEGLWAYVCEEMREREFEEWACEVWVGDEGELGCVLCGVVGKGFVAG